jgi:major membrane immunogen (membrane-anchored lipoprotein)
MKALVLAVIVASLLAACGDNQVAPQCVKSGTGTGDGQQQTGNGDVSACNEPK